jgi:hypothetical protein
MSYEKSHNDEKWFQLNDFDSNQEYTEKILKKFNLQKYHFVYDQYGNLSLLIEQNLKKYKIIMDEKNRTFNIYRCDVHLNFGKYTKENMILKKTVLNNCIYNSIKWVSKNSQI